MNGNKYPKRKEQQPQQQPQQPQEAKRESGKWVEIVNLYHQGGSTYKKLGVYVTDDLKVILSLTEREAKGEYIRINFQLSEQELIYLAEKLRHLFFRTGK